MCVSLDCMILDIMSGIKMHMLVFFYACSNIVKYLLNRGLLCKFCTRMGLTVEDNYSIVVVLFVIPSQLNNGLFNKLVSSIWPLKKP